jgi:hypothetical protein
MILELNTENIKKLELGKLRFTKEEITNLLSRKENHTINDIYFDYKNQKIYTGIDMARNFLNQNKDYKPFPFSYPDLIPEYYNIKLAIYLKDKQRLLGIIYNEVEQTKEFINEQLKEIKSIINDSQTYLDKIPPRSHNYRRKAIIIHKAYVFYLEKIFKEPQQIEINKPNKIKKEIKSFIQNINDKENFIIKLKELFLNEKGKPIKAMIRILERNEILLIPDRQFLSFYNSLQTEFNRDIGTYTSINDVKDKDFDEAYLGRFEKALKPLITRYKTK